MGRKPMKIRISEEGYTATVLQIIEKDPDGKPRLLRVMYDKEEITLQGGEEFAVVYGSDRVFLPPESGGSA